ncbi:unnamed protein product [Chondrus crispus]|uniref:Uncharacterized protein n=1 Tax=Chondrus crispus TaxID=2769 RepID=R7QRB2_CHOCR|nr:unnamed protein product [Chondrus crispus]CDF40689.1 unnamed protein product [Chondrus crispus]|eukprot:XP_005710983.1 unnamed protein product [Chondrus crispus]
MPEHVPDLHSLSLEQRAHSGLPKHFSRDSLVLKMHFPFTHSLERHCTLPLQLAHSPFGKHCGEFSTEPLTHLPSRQVPEPHCRSFLQLSHSPKKHLRRERLDPSLHLFGMPVHLPVLHCSPNLQRSHSSSLKHLRRDSALSKTHLPFSQRLEPHSSSTSQRPHSLRKHLIRDSFVPKLQRLGTPEHLPVRQSSFSAHLAHSGFLAHLARPAEEKTHFPERQSLVAQLNEVLQGLHSAAKPHLSRLDSFPSEHLPPQHLGDLHS